ncbi:hypothetical protein APHAL10511_000940 [Amanita phalloides]|nr:hypothetical protein APHAL10511_000940 [Amanita phalloides]
MVTWMPISAAFVRYADHFIDPALGFAIGINYFILQAFLVPFEIVAFGVMLRFWTDKIPTVAIVFMVLGLYALINLFAVRYYGEFEYWLALGKVILATGLIIFTFVTMVGGNPTHDAYGFRYWNPSKIPGTPFTEYIETGSLGRFLGFLACLTQASFTIAGPDFVALTAGEAEMPRSSLPRAFRSVFYRLTTFFVIGALCVGIVIPYSDPALLNALSNAQPNAGSSPYVIAMKHLHIPVVPHIVNALILTAVFSAGNSYVYCASRALYGLALEGKMPRFLAICSSNGVPVFCVLVTLGISCISFLQVSHNSAVVLQWIINLGTAAMLLTYALISFTYLRFYNALKAHGISRDSLPYKTFWQPFCGYYALSGTLIMTFVNGYTVFLPGRWNTTTFFFSYTMIGVVPLLYILWKLLHKTKLRKLEDITFFDAERLKVDNYEQEMSGSL